MEDWLKSNLDLSITNMELPVLIRLFNAFEKKEYNLVKSWTEQLLVRRETFELRREENQRGKALYKILSDLGVEIPMDLKPLVSICQLTGFALAANKWGIELEKICNGYVWSWLENSVVAGLKLIPLGQTQGQKIIFNMSKNIPNSVSLAKKIEDNMIFNSTPALAIASSRHESQYTRFYRS